MKQIFSLRRIGVAGLCLALVAGAAGASKGDLKRIINESASFLRNREPEMTAGEYALYEKVVAMLSVQPEFAMQLLQQMMAGRERPSPAFEFVLVNAQYNAGRGDLAEAHYRRAIERYPEYLRAWANLGVVYYGDGRFEQAVECFSRAVALGDNTADTLGMLGYSHQRVGNPVAAEMAYLRAVTEAPANADWNEGLCRLYLESKQYGRAEPLARLLVKLQPNEPRHWQQYARLLVAQERRMEAIVVLESARGLQLANDEMRLELGDLYAQAGLNPEALATYREAGAGGANRLITMARITTENGQPEAAAEILKSLEPTLPADAKAAFLRARAETAIARKDWAPARRDLEAAVALQPLDGALLLRLGQVLKNADAPAAAAQVLEAATRRPDGAYQAYLELADIALRTRQFRACVSHLERAQALQQSVAIQQYLVRIRTLAQSDENQPRE